MLSRRSNQLCLFAVIFFGLTCTWAQEHRVHNFQQVQISPDGRRVAWVQDTVGANNEEAEGTAIYLDDLKPGSKPRRISASTGTPEDEDNIAWSRDSKQLAFLSNAEDRNQAQIYVAEAENGKARKLTSLTGSLAEPSFSPDGKSLAFLFTENAPRANPLMPMPLETGVIAEKIFEQRLTLVDLANGKVQQLSPADMYVYEYDWSPDGKSFVLSAAHGAGDANWYVAQLYTMDAADGKPQPLYKPHWQIAAPRWSPDGKSVAFIEGLMSDEGVTGGDIFIVPSSGGSATNITPDLPASPSAVHWLSPSKLLFAESIDGEAGVATIDLPSHTVTQLWKAPGNLKDSQFSATNLSLASDGQTSAVMRNDWEHPPELWAGLVGKWTQITHLNETLHGDWGQMKSIHWDSDGMRIQGWLMYPKSYDANQHHPMVVVAHGGPASQDSPSWPYRFFNTYEFSNRGYFVFYPNPRGSYGQGERFTQGNIKDFGHGDFLDILRGVDQVLNTASVDKNRVGITGWSYGGYMTMWAVTQTTRFRAAVAGAGIANWQSYYGENDIDEWMIPYFGASVYDNPDVYARSAPITFIKNVKTPTLVLVGERDGECPAPQSREFWHALKTLGVDTELVIYPGEGHVFNRPDNQRDATQRLFAWFDHYLK